MLKNTLKKLHEKEIIKMFNEKNEMNNYKIKLHNAQDFPYYYSRLENN